MNVLDHIYNQILALSGESHGYINSYNSDYDNIFSIHYFDSNKQPEISFGQITMVRYIDFQVFVRDTSFETGYARIDAIRNLFQSYNYEEITIIPRSDILMLGNDEKNRSMLVINFSMKLIDVEEEEELSTEVINANHDDFNVNANIQIGNTDAGRMNPVPAYLTYSQYKNNALVVTSNPTLADMPTYDGSGLAAHVNIVYIPEGFQGYKYWCVMTPYPNNDDSYENPSIIVSNDLDTWAVPTGLTNPIVTPPVDGSHYSDVSICYSSSSELLVVYYRWTSSDANTNKVYYKTSADGVTWSNAGEVTFVNLEGGNLISPQVLINNSRFEMYGINNSTKKIEKYISSDAATYTLSNILQTNNVQGTPWHITTQIDEKGYHFIVSFHNNDILRTKLYYGFSPDGNIIGWDNEPLLKSKINSAWEKATYVGSIIPYEEKWKLFITPIDDEDSGLGTYVCDAVFTGAKNELRGTYPVATYQSLRTTDIQSVDVSKIMQRYKIKSIYVANNLDHDVQFAIYASSPDSNITDAITVASGTARVITGLTSGTISWSQLDRLYPQMFSYNFKYAALDTPTSGTLSIFIQCEE